MYCGECGAKNEKGAKFCESCGAKLEEIKEEKPKKAKTTPEKPKDKRPISKKTKIIIIAVAAVVVVLIAGFMILRNSTSPETIAKNYYAAYVKQNIDQMYSYCDLGEGGAFTNKEAFKEYYSDGEKADLAKRIKNYKITNIQYDDSRLTATVTVSYTTGSSSSAQTDTITLRRGSGKKYLFFDDWKVSLNDDDLVTDYTIRVPHDATITVDDVALSTEYIEESDDDGFDVYTIPMMFNTEYDVVVKLANGFEIQDTFTPSNYYGTTTFVLSNDNISDADKEKVTEQVKQDIKSLFDNAIADKAWSEISSNYGTDDLDDLEDSYEELVDDVDGGFLSSKLQSFDVDTVNIRGLSTESDGRIEVWVRLEYKYTTSESDGTTEEHTSADTVYMYYTAEQDGLKLKDASSLPSYF